MIDAAKIKFVTFDCFGTLVDWDTGIKNFLEGILPRKNQSHIGSIIKRWEVNQLKLVQGKYAPYKDLQKKSFTQTFNELNIIPIKDRLDEQFLATISKLEPFPDVYPVLSKLKNSFKLVLVSNGLLSILRKNVKKMGIKFDKIISAELIGAYKPSLDVFRYVLKQLNCPSSEILHVAAGYKYDVIPAKTLGIRTIWVNRKQIPYPGKVSPDCEIRDLTKLPIVMNYL